MVLVVTDPPPAPRAAPRGRREPDAGAHAVRHVVHHREPLAEARHETDVAARLAVEPHVTNRAAPTRQTHVHALRRGRAQRYLRQRHALAVHRPTRHLLGDGDDLTVRVEGSRAANGSDESNRVSTTHRLPVPPLVLLRAPPPRLLRLDALALQGLLPVRVERAKDGSLASRIVGFFFTFSVAASCAADGRLQESPRRRVAIPAAAALGTVLGAAGAGAALGALDRLVPLPLALLEPLLRLF